MSKIKKKIYKLSIDEFNSLPSINEQLYSKTSKIISWAFDQDSSLEEFYFILKDLVSSLNKNIYLKEDEILETN